MQLAPLQKVYISAQFDPVFCFFCIVMTKTAAREEIKCKHKLSMQRTLASKGQDTQAAINGCHDQIGIIPLKRVAHWPIFFFLSKEVVIEYKKNHTLIKLFQNTSVYRQNIFAPSFVRPRGHWGRTEPPSSVVRKRRHSCRGI